MESVAGSRQPGELTSVQTQLLASLQAWDGVSSLTCKPVSTILSIFPSHSRRGSLCCRATCEH